MCLIVVYWGHHTGTKPTQKLLNDMLHMNHQLEISGLTEKKKRQKKKTSISVEWKQDTNLKKTLQ